jgi:hypothetical protein
MRMTVAELLRECAATLSGIDAGVQRTLGVLSARHDASARLDAALTRLTARPPGVRRVSGTRPPCSDSPGISDRSGKREGRRRAA